MSSINPADAPGYTQMYSFGVKVSSGYGEGERTEHLVMTVRAPSEELARRHILAIFRGVYAGSTLQFFTDMDIWKHEAGTEAKRFPLTSDEAQALPEPIRTIYSVVSPLHVSNETTQTLAVELQKDGLPSVQVIPPYMQYAFQWVERVIIHVIEKPAAEPYEVITDNEHAAATYNVETFAQAVSKRVGVTVDSVLAVMDIMRVHISGQRDLTITEDMVVGWILAEMYYQDKKP